MANLITANDSKFLNILQTKVNGKMSSTSQEGP